MIPDRNYIGQKLTGSTVWKKQLIAHEFAFMSQRSISGIEVKMTGVNVLNDIGHHWGIILFFFTHSEENNF